MTKTLPVGLADSHASLWIEAGSACTLVSFVTIMPRSILLQWLARRDRTAS
ncbi:ABC transporter, permease protein 2 (cluster 1, maltose/g3p/polyamine/iron) [Azospirillum doebereinerae]